MKRPADLRTLAVNWAAATVFAALFLGLGAQLDSDADAANTIARADLQALAMEARMVQGATALCEAEHGPGARAGFTGDNTLVCHPAASTLALNNAPAPGAQAGPQP